MAGHSKWANIKHRKGRQDEKRQKVFSKLIRELTVAAKLGGPEPGDNPRLRLALDKALGANMPKDTIERAIARGSGDQEAEIPKAFEKVPHDESERLLPGAPGVREDQELHTCQRSCSF